MVEIAKIQSTEASNKIEGIYTSDERLRALVKDTTRPKTRSEREIAGYRDVLNTIHEIMIIFHRNRPSFCSYIEIYINLKGQIQAENIKWLTIL